MAIPASNGGLACIGAVMETEACNTEGCPINCEWGSYETWSPCSKTCDRGYKSRARQVKTPASYGGQACEGGATQTKACITHTCPRE